MNQIGQPPNPTERYVMMQMADHIRTVAEAYLEMWFGERCDDFDPNCVVCQKWKQLDDLLET